MRVAVSDGAPKAQAAVALVASLVMLLPLSLMGQAYSAVEAASTGGTPSVRATSACAPDEYCVALGAPSRHDVSTINSAGLNCMIAWTVNWGDGTAADSVAVLPGQIVEVSHTYQALGTYTENAEPSIDPSSDPACFEVPGGWRYEYVWHVVELLAARIAPVTPVSRGGHAFIDASASRGPAEIESYSWDFTPEGDCPPGLVLANPSLTTTEATLDIVVLCDLLVRLTVQDVDGHTAQQTAHVSVHRRKTGQWEPTKVDLVPEGSSADPRTPRNDFLWGRVDDAFALTVSRCRRDDQPESLCPPTDGLGTLEGKAFNVTDVSDPLGPFHGFWFMIQNNVRVKQTGLFNPNMFSSSTIKHRDPADPRMRVNWFAFNRRHERPVDELISAVRMHEGWGKNGSAAHPNNSGHVGAKACYLRNKQTRHNPAVVLEALFDRSRADLVSHANDSLRRINGEMKTAAADATMPIVWRGSKFFWDPATHSWKLEAFTIGRVRRAPTC
jgi:hypothetical protein